MLSHKSASVPVMDPDDIVVFSTPSDMELGLKKEEDEEVEPDAVREELKWMSDIEKTILGWEATARENVIKHGKMKKYYKRIYNVFGGITAALPIAVGFVNAGVGENSRTLMSVLMGCTGVLVGIYERINAGKKAEQYSHYEYQYSQLANEIHSEMIKPRRNRPAADVYLQKILDRVNSIDSGAPDT